MIQLKKLFTIAFMLLSVILGGVSAEAKPKLNVPKETFNGLFEGKALNVKELIEQKKSFVLQVFAPWCHYCKEEHDALIALKDKRPDIEIDAIIYNPGMVMGLEGGCSDTKNILREKQKGCELFKKENSLEHISLGYPFTTVGIDPDGRKSAELISGQPVVPQTFIIIEGKLEERIVGKMENKDLVKTIEKYFPKKGTRS